MPSFCAPPSQMFALFAILLSSPHHSICLARKLCLILSLLSILHLLPIYWSMRLLAMRVWTKLGYSREESVKPRVLPPGKRDSFLPLLICTHGYTRSMDVMRSSLQALQRTRQWPSTCMVNEISLRAGLREKKRQIQTQTERGDGAGCQRKKKKLLR